MSEKRDKINFNTISIGAILMVYPKESSHSEIPYKVKVIESTTTYFKTKLVGFTIKTHKIVFEYDSWEWKNYHHDRFKILSL